MALAVADRAKETSTSTGTGTINLDGAISGYQTLLAGAGDGNTTYYCIQHRSANEWEVGLGTVTSADPNTLSRDTILSSSNAGSAVDFSAGTKEVFITEPSSRAGLFAAAKATSVLAALDSSGYLTSGGSGVDNRVAIWSGTNTQDSSADLTFDGSTFTVGGSLISFSPTTLIGTDRTLGKLTVRQDNTGGQFVALNEGASGSSGGAGWTGYHDDGAAMASGDRLAMWIAGGAKDAAANLNNSVSFGAYATENWSSTACGAKLQIELTPNGSTGRQAVAVFDQAGQFQLPITGSSGGVRIGGDFDLYRSDTNVGYTPDSFSIGSTLSVGPSPNSIYKCYVSATANTNASWRSGYFYQNLTSTISGNWPAAIYAQQQINASSSTVSWASGLTASIRVGSGQSGTITEIYGLSFDIWHSGSASIGTMAAGGGLATIRNTSSGTISGLCGYRVTLDAQSGGTTSAVTAAYGFDYYCSHNGSGTWTSFTGFYARDNSGTGTITTLYGFRVADLDSGGTNYAIYLEGTSGLARQGIWWNGDLNLFRVAADRGHSDDSWEFLTARVDGDAGGIASMTSFTNATDSLGESTVTTTIRSGNGSSQHTGYIKIYVGTTAYYVPYWS